MVKRKLSETTASQAAALKASIAQRLAEARAKASRAPKSSGTNNGHRPPQGGASSVASAATAAASSTMGNPYLAHTVEADDEDFVDHDLKTVTRNKMKGSSTFSFFESGTFEGASKRLGEKAKEVAKSGHQSGRKGGLGATNAKGDKEDVYGGGGGELEPRHGVMGRCPIVVEWWDMEMLPKEARGKVREVEAAREKAARARNPKKEEEAGEMSRVLGDERDALLAKLDLRHSKTAKYVQHPVPVKPLGYKDEPQEQATIFLTAKERKRQRRLDRAARLQDLRDKQALGLVPAPEPKLTLGNFMKVVGDAAVMDPSKMEAKVVAQVNARKEKHEAANEARKLTKEQRREKAERKRKEDTSAGVAVAAFWVKDAGHRYHRAKLDLNAQQNNLTGVVAEAEGGGAIVIVEGGTRGVGRFEKVMTRRMNWTGEGLAPPPGDSEGYEKSFDPENTCRHLWTGKSLRPVYQGFTFQAGSREAMTKMLEARGHGALADFDGAESTTRAADDWNDDDDDAAPPRPGPDEKNKT